jgi:hypothetical protein
MPQTPGDPVELSGDNWSSLFDEADAAVHLDLKHLPPDEQQDAA